MRMQSQMPKKANQLLLAAGVLLALGLLFGLVQLVNNQSFVVFAQEDDIIGNGEGVDAEGGPPTGTVDGESNGTGEDYGDADNSDPAEEVADPAAEEAAAEEAEAAEEVVEEAEAEAEVEEATEEAAASEAAQGALSPMVYLPYIGTSPPIPSISNTKPNSLNNWLVNWEVVDDSRIDGYILQESQKPDFSSGVTEYTVGNVTSQFIDKTASPNNTYFFRVASVSNDLVSEWSDTITVHGAYLDNFSDDTTGWTSRRMTYLEETNVYYGSGAEEGYLIAITADRWDWVLGSPFRYAPEVPYQVDYRMRVHDPSNLVSGGVVLGGDWNGDACPEIGNVYQTDNCFNQFYNFNMIYFGPMKLLFEQVDRLNYCPTCGGSQIKRLGPTEVVENINGLGNPANDWHNFRITVEEDGMRFYVDDKFVRHFTDTTYINRPYFGVFTSTDEYKPSIYFYDYFSVTPID